MAVKPETIKFERGFAKGGKVFRTASNTQVQRLERATNGAWFLTVRVALEFDLHDGRKIAIDKTVRLRGAQEGKLPHPDPFGHKKLRKMKRQARLIQALKKELTTRSQC